jgi:DNA-binding response OmpR family regulator
VTRNFTITEPNLRNDAPPRAMRVLVVDDDRDMVLSLITLLRTEAYEARGLYQAMDIVQQVREFDPEVVILDIAMPGMTGWEAAQAIRAAISKKIVLVGMSGEYTSGADRSVSRQRGFDLYLMKPYDPNVLLTALRFVGIQSPYRSPFR